MERITSVHNPRIKDFLNLQSDSRERRRRGLFVVEGRRELEHCLQAGFRVETVFHCPEITPQVPESARLCRVTEVSPDVYGRMALRSGTEGLVAEVKTRDLSLSALDGVLCASAGMPESGSSEAVSPPLVIVLESVEKPGNLGAVLRSADAAGTDAVLVCDPLTDLYNPNLIRASLGAVFTVPLAVCTSEEAIGWLQSRGYAILTAQLQDSDLYYDFDMTGPTAIVLGTESVGLSEAWRQAATAHIRIPMLGKLDSLNVSVSAAVLMFEAVRQRSLARFLQE